MKPIILAISTLSIIALCISASSCSKSSSHTPVNTTLYDKPLNVIQQYITGNWKMIYTDGGFVAIKQYYDSVYWQLSSTSIKVTYPQDKGGVVINDNNINWKRYPIGGVDSSYILECYDVDSILRDFAMMKIYNDTLIMHENAVDGYYYHLIKSN